MHKLWEDIDTFQEIPNDKQIFIGGDLNGHVEKYRWFRFRRMERQMKMLHIKSKYWNREVLPSVCDRGYLLKWKVNSCKISNIIWVNVGLQGPTYPQKCHKNTDVKWMCVIQRLNRQNYHIWQKVQVAQTIGHAIRWSLDAPICKCETMVIEDIKWWWGRPKTTMKEVISRPMISWNLYMLSKK